MKKIFAILALAISSTAFAGSFTLESQNINNVTSADQKQYVLGVRHNFNNTVAGDVIFSNAQTDGTNALSTRLEAGLTVSAPLFGSVKGYTRAAYGQKFTNTANFDYYSVEPGVTMPVGPFTAKLGWRYRSAVEAVNNDQTHAARASLAYALTKNDSIGIGYDRVHGDSDQKITKVSYTRSF